MTTFDVAPRANGAASSAPTAKRARRRRILGMGNSETRRNEGFFVYLLAAVPESVVSRVESKPAQSRRMIGSRGGPRSAEERRARGDCDPGGLRARGQGHQT